MIEFDDPKDDCDCPRDLIALAAALIAMAHCITGSIRIYGAANARTMYADMNKDGLHLTIKSK